MEMRAHNTVAVLLATYNGACHVEEQIRSLEQNATRFTLHWLDDHSNDDTRKVVSASARAFGIDLVEWHQSQHEGVPGAFFRLIERVEADIYLFCDQDDIWQPGKIDATVANLLPDLALPVLCFSDPFIFNEGEPRALKRCFESVGMTAETSLEVSRLFLHNPCLGHTVGFTRPLREIILRHLDTARTYAVMHDSWMYAIAVACGVARMLFDTPTTLYRMHGNNVFGLPSALSGWRDSLNLRLKWRRQQAFRRWVSRSAQGFCIAAITLPPGPTLERLLPIARVVATLDRRQPPSSLVRLARRKALPPSLANAAWLVVTCLFSHANV